jgi:hypothetical protein
VFTHQCLQTHLSIVRWESYRQTPQEVDADIWQRYQENLQLCQGLYVPLHLFEISLRNHLHILLKSKDVNWCTGYFSGKDFQYQGTILVKQGQDRLADAIYTLTNKKRLPQPTEGQIVAELNFGFWVELFSNSYSSLLWAYTQKGGDTLRTVFPALPNNYVLQANAQTVTNVIYPCLKIIVFLRNRIFHHEPIWHEKHFNVFQKQNPALAKKFLTYTQQNSITCELIEKTLSDVLAWICPDLLQDIQSFKY